MEVLFDVRHKSAAVLLFFLYLGIGSLEPLKLEQLIRSFALSRVFLQTSEHELFGLWTCKLDFLHIRLMSEYLVVDSGLINTREWEFAIAQQIESDDAQLPNVNLLVWHHDLLGPDQLRRHVEARSEPQLQTVRLIFFVKPGREMELIDLDAWAFWTHVVNQDVVRLQVPVHNVIRMQALHSVYNLTHNVLDVFFGESFRAKHLVFECAECSIFVSELIKRHRLRDFEDFYDVWMVDFLKVL